MRLCRLSKFAPFVVRSGARVDHLVGGADRTGVRPAVPPYGDPSPRPPWTNDVSVAFVCLPACYVDDPVSIACRLENCSFLACSAALDRYSRLATSAAASSSLGGKFFSSFKRICWTNQEYKRQNRHMVCEMAEIKEVQIHERAPETECDETAV